MWQRPCQVLFVSKYTTLCPGYSHDFFVVGQDRFPATAAYTILVKNKLGVNIPVGTNVWVTCSDLTQGKTWYGYLSFEILRQILTVLSLLAASAMAIAISGSDCFWPPRCP